MRGPKLTFIIDLIRKTYFINHSVMNQVGNSNFPPSVHLIFFSTNIRNENNTREIQKWPRARDRTSLISLRCGFFYTN
jgi:hypothetical protein